MLTVQSFYHFDFITVARIELVASWEDTSLPVIQFANLSDNDDDGFI